MKLIVIVISVISLTFCSGIRVPTSWASTPADGYTNHKKTRHPTEIKLPGNTHRFGYHVQPHVIQQPGKEIPTPLAVAHQKYIRNKDIVKKTSLQVDNKKKPPLVVQNRYSQPVIQNQDSWVPIVGNKVNKRNYGQTLVAQNAVTTPNKPEKPVQGVTEETKPAHNTNQRSQQSKRIPQEIKPVYEFDYNFNPVIPSSRNNFFDNSPKSFFDEFTFLPLPKPRDPYEERKERILLKNHRDDETHEPSKEDETEGDKEDEKNEEADKEEVNEEDDKAEAQEEEAEEDSEDEEGEKAPISEHETPAEVPTRPIYPGEGKWAQRGSQKHRPYISNHKFTELEDDGEKLEGHDVFDRAQHVYDRQSNRFAGNLAAFPGRHKFGHYTKPEETEPAKETDDAEETEELSEDEEDEDFVPTQVYSQVRRTEDEEHLPPVYEGPAKLREVIKDSKIQTVYTEEGYEDIAYDHAGHEKEASENEGFAEAEEEVKKEKLKKVPRKKYRLEPPGDSAIEESNYDNSRSVVSPNEVSAKEDTIKNETKKEPIIRNNNNFMKTHEIKTTAVKDTENGEKEMEVLSEIKIMMIPNSNGTKLHKFVKVIPKNYKLSKKPHAKQSSVPVEVTSPKTIEKEIENVPTTLQPRIQSSPEAILDGIPIPTTSTEALPFLGVHKNSSDSQHEQSVSKEDVTNRTLIRKKRFTNDFEKFEIDTDFIDKINHTLPLIEPDRTHEKYPYYFMNNFDEVNKNSALRYAEDLRNAPEKVYGELSFYEQAHNKVPCEEVETDVDPIPDRVKDAEKNAEEMKESGDVAELAESPRLKGLGDKIRCFKKRYFGENPLDSPFFKEGLVPAVTPPYHMPLPYSLDKFQTSIQGSQNRGGYSVLQNHAPLDSSSKSQATSISGNSIEKKDDELSENASNLSEKSSESISPKENEVNIDGPRENSKAKIENAKILNRYLNKYIKTSDSEAKDDYSGLETFEDDTEESDDDTYVGHEDFGKKLNVKNQDEEGTGGVKSENLKSKDHPTKFTLTVDEDSKTKKIKTKEQQDEDEVGLNLFQDIIGRLLKKSNDTKNETTEAETSTTNPDAEVINVDKLPIPTTTPVINIITTPKYTIDLTPKHIYDQIELLRYLPIQESEETSTTTTEKTEVTTSEELPPKTEQSVVHDESDNKGSSELTEEHFDPTIEPKVLTKSESNEDVSREPKILVKEANSKMDEEDESAENESGDKPESFALRGHRRKQKRKRPFVVFDVNRFWPTTPFPFFQKPIKHSTVLPKHKVHSEVHYKDEIKPSEQLTVLTDVLNIIKNSSQEPLMVAETHDNRIQYNRVKHPVRVTNYDNQQSSFQNYPTYFNNIPQKVALNKYLQNNRYPQPTKTIPKQVKQGTRPAVIFRKPQIEEEISTKLKNSLRDQEDEEDEIEFYTSHDITKIRPQDQTIDSAGSTSMKSSVTVNRGKTKSSERQEGFDYIQDSATDVLGLVPPGSKNYRTIYKTQSPRGQPTSVNRAIEKVPVNRFYVEGMKPPPESQNVNLYSNLNTPVKAHRRFHIRPRIKRQTKPSYTELVRSRGSQYQAGEETKTAEEEDDYVPHRPKNYHYDEKTGKIVYDNAKTDEKQDEGDVEYAVVYEEVTEKPVSTTTVSWIATAKPNKDEKPLLFFVEKLKSHPDYKLIPDPVPTEKSTELEASAQEISTAVTPLSSTTPPPFLNILEKVKSDSNYKLIPDKTTEKPTTTTTTEAALEEVEEEVIEESKVENVQNSPGEQDPSLSGLIFDISEFLPKTKVYQPQTSIDYSKYKTIERAQVNTRHNLSSRYNAETDKQLQEVNTKKVPIVQTTGSGSEETQQVSESRIDEQTPAVEPAQPSTSTERVSTHRNVRRRSRVISTTTLAPTTEITSTVEPPKSTTSEQENPSTESKPSSERSTPSESSPATETTTTSTTITTSSTIATTKPTQAKVEEISTSSPRRVRIRGRIRSSTIKTPPSGIESTTTASTTSTTTTTTEKPNEGTTQKKLRRRPARVKVRSSTEKYFEEGDVDKSAKVVQRRQSGRTYYDTVPSTLAPWRLAPIIVENDRDNSKTKQLPPISLENAQLSYIPIPRETLVPPEVDRNFQQNPSYLTQPIPLSLSENSPNNPAYKETYIPSLATGSVGSDPLYNSPTFAPQASGNTPNIPTYRDSYNQPLIKETIPDKPASSKQLLAPLAIGNISPDLTYNQPYLPLSHSPYSSLSRESSAPPERAENVPHSSLSEEVASSPQEERKQTSKETLFAPVTVGTYTDPLTLGPYTAVPLDYSSATVEPTRPQGRRRSRINRLHTNPVDNHSGFISSTAQPFTSVTLQGIQNTPQDNFGSLTTQGVTTTETVRIQARRRQGIDPVEPTNLDALIAPLIAVSTSTEQPIRVAEVDTVRYTTPIPSRGRNIGRQRNSGNSGTESRNFNVPVDSVKINEFSLGISSPAPFTAVPSGSTTADPQKPQTSRQRINGLESRKLNIAPSVQPILLEAATFAPIKQPTFGPPVVLDFFTSTTTEAPKPTRRRRPRIRLSKTTDDSQKSDATNTENREARRIRGGTVRRLPERRQPERRRGNIVQQQMKHQRDSIDDTTESTTTISQGEDFKDYYLKHKHKHYNKEVPETPRRRKITTELPDGEKIQSRNVDVEVTHNYNKRQRHGGNYRSEAEGADVSGSGSINTRNEKIVLDSERVQPNKVDVEVFNNYNTKRRHGGNYRSQDGHTINPVNIDTSSQNRDQNINSNINVFKTYDTQQKHDGNFQGQTKNAEVFQPIISKEPVQKLILNPDSIQNQNVNIEAFRDYDKNQKHGGNYKKEDDTVAVRTGIVNTRNGRVVTNLGSNQNQNTNPELIKNYHQNQRHESYYKEQYDDIEPGFVGKKDEKSHTEPEIIQTKEINAETFKTPDFDQSSYRSKSEDTGIIGRGNTNSNSGKLIIDPALSLERQTNAGVLYNAGFNSNYDSSEELDEEPQITTGSNQKIADSERTRSEKVNVEVFKEYNPLQRHGGNYRRRDDSEDDATVHIPPPKQRRRRPLPSTTTVAPTEAESYSEIRRNNLRRRDPSEVKNTPDTRVRNNLVHRQKANPDQDQYSKFEDSKQQEPQETPSKQTTVEAFKEYDRNNQHGGNYRPAQEEESKQKPLLSSDPADVALDVLKLLTIPLTSVKGTGAKQVAPPEPTVQAVTERLKNLAPKPFAYYNDAKLAKNVNQLKDLTIPEAVTEELIESVAHEDTADDEYGDLPVYLGTGVSPTSTSLPTTTTARPESIFLTTTTSLPNIIKDPSKRLYYYASV